MGAVVVAVACSSPPKRTVRTDLAPLSKRLDLPAGVGEARWVATDANEVGCAPSVPEPDASLQVYASLTLDAAAWKTLEARPGYRTTPGALTLPDDIAPLILPASIRARLGAEDLTPVPGRAIENSHLVRGGGVSVVRALRADDTLLVELRLRGS